jgi:hypothetical protein
MKWYFQSKKRETEQGFHDTIEKNSDAKVSTDDAKSFPSEDRVLAIPQDDEQDTSMDQASDLNGKSDFKC